MNQKPDPSNPSVPADAESDSAEDENRDTSAAEAAAKEAGSSQRRPTRPAADE